MKNNPSTTQCAIFHIPHSSTQIPSFEGFVCKRIENEVKLLTDWSTDHLFCMEGVERIVTPWSRVFCDVERFPDSREVMESVGMGVCYTRTDAGKLLRRLSKQSKQRIIQTYYQAHHARLEAAVQDRLKHFGICVILDCHSFSSTPLLRELNQDRERPDICLGADSFHTPSVLAETVKHFFERKGFTVAINAPYTGTIVPLRYYHAQEKVKSMMIEVNKKLYMDECTLTININRVLELRALLSQAIYQGLEAIAP